jgi:hypothetical protein
MLHKEYSVPASERVKQYKWPTLLSPSLSFGSKQCFGSKSGSRSTWICMNIDLLDPDLDPGARKLAKKTKDLGPLLLFNPLCPASI